MARKRKGKTARLAAKNQIGSGETEEVKRAPHTFVLYRKQVGKSIAHLMKDFRKVMEPYTASQLKVLKSNVLKDYVAVAGPLNVSHIILFTKSPEAVYMRIIRLPRGPTLTFRVKNFSLARDVLSYLKKPVTYARQFQHHPLVVVNNFSGEGQHLKLMATTFQNMFPSINVNTLKLNDIRRCVLFNYNHEDKTVDFRHYTIKVVPTGMSKPVKKIIQNKIPDLSNYADISDFVTKGGNLSESEAELDGPHNQVILPQKVGSHANMVSQQSAVRLVELGPRLTLQLYKIEDGMNGGEVLYHDFIKKTPEEIEALRRHIAKKDKLKQKRKQQQAENVRKKAQEAAAHKERSMGKGKSGEEADDEEDEDVEAPEADGGANSGSDDDDSEWYRKETGLVPDKDLFPSGDKKKGKNLKRKMEDKGQKFSNKKRKVEQSRDSKPFKSKLNPEKKKFATKTFRKDKGFKTKPGKRGMKMPQKRFSAVKRKKRN